MPPPGLGGPSATRTPERLGKYELLTHLATGGMAEIHLARVTGIEGFEKIVVVKRILPALVGNKEIVHLFLDEARLAATLHHPNIVQVYDVGVASGSYFFSMEFIHGEDARTLLKTITERRAEIPLDVALSIVIGVCAGLNYAHEKRGFDGKPLGIIHRDVSPSNVLVSYDGSVKVVDFGIAKAASRSQETQHGSVRGKFGYMSPEQCESKPLDPRSDLFAIGILLFELTTCSKLYKGESDYAIMKQIVEEAAPPPSSRKPGYPPELERIVMKALSRDRDERYPTAQDLQLDLEAFAREAKVAISAVTVKRFMERIFGQKIESWQEAQKSGTNLIEHIAQTITQGTPSYSALGLDAVKKSIAKLPQAALPGVAEPPPPSRSSRRLLLGGLLAISLGVAGAALVRTSTKPPLATLPSPAPSPPVPVPGPGPVPVPSPTAARLPDLGTTIATTVPAPVADTKPSKSHSRSKSSSSTHAAATPPPATTPPPTPPATKPKPKAEWDPDSPVPP